VKKSPSPLLSKTGRESFRFIRLLESLVVVIYTSILSGFGVVAMTMEQLQILEIILAAFRAGNDMVDFQQVSILKKQTAVTTHPFLSF
jgi:hypothetical protein